MVHQAESGPGPVLVLTGERANRQVVVRLDDQPLALTYSQFALLVRLIIARGTTRTGFVEDADSAYAVAVCRLRKALDRVTGRGTGRTLIQTGAGEEYRLGVPVTCVALEPSCAELLTAGLLTAEELQELRRLCRLL
jgi:hypothetical protein